MTIDVGIFRSIFPEFQDATSIPDALIQFNLDLAYNSLPPEVWGDRLDAAAGFYAAHFVALAVQRAVSVALGRPVGSVGVASGIMSSKSVGSVSASYDVGVGQTEGGGSFNLTQYGQSYLTLLASTAAGALQF